MTQPTYLSAPVAALLRLLAAWLVGILVLQALQVGMALGAGPRHSHSSVAAADAGPTQPHVHWHADLERHYHPCADASVHLADPQEATWQAASLAVSLALALPVLALLHVPARGARHVLRPASPWALCLALLPPPLKPPRLG